MLNLYFNAEKIVIVCAHCKFEKKDGKIFHCGHIMNNVYYKPEKPEEFQFNFIKEESIKVEGKREWCSYLGIQSKLGQCFNIKTDSYYDWDAAVKRSDSEKSNRSDGNDMFGIGSYY